MRVETIRTHVREPRRFLAPARAPASAQRGFTLLEVLVALLLMSLALVALVRVSSLEAQATAHLRDVTLAQWVGANALAETRLRDPFPGIGRNQGEETMGGQRWRWRIDVSATDEATIRRMDVQVQLAESPDDSPAVISLVGFASQR